MEELIRSLGGTDLQLLGLGHNGHIGFNEPSAVFEADTLCRPDRKYDRSK